jgi:acyl-CoA dehydrogenase
VQFDNYRVPPENVLASEGGDGFKLAMRTFARTRPYISAIAVGTARSAMEFAIEYVKKRRAFGQPLADFQALQFKIAEMYQKIETSRLLTWRAAWEADSGGDPTVSASMSKFYTSEAACEVVNDAMQIFGGYGYTKFMPIEKLYRDARVLTIYEGTSQIQRMVVGRHALNNYVSVMPPLEDLPRLNAEDAAVAAQDGVDTNQTGWRCRICGYIHYGDTPPEECPVCGFPQGTFKQVWPRS